MEWVSIEDKHPEGDCLVYLEDDGLNTSRMQAANYHRNITTIGNHFYFDMPNVTHWMPLPEPPKEEDEK